MFEKLVHGGRSRSGFLDVDLGLLAGVDWRRELYQCCLESSNRVLAGRNSCRSAQRAMGFCIKVDEEITDSSSMPEVEVCFIAVVCGVTGKRCLSDRFQQASDKLFFMS
jgi:hypothetical protein